MQRKMTMPISAIVMGAAYAYGAVPSLTPTDVEKLQQYMETSHLGVTSAVKDLTSEQWNFKPAPDRWSIAQIVEHMVLAQEVVLGPVREELKKAPAPSPDRDYVAVDAIVWNQFPDRSHKFQAPDVLQPSGRWSPADSLERLAKNYSRLNEFLESTPDLRAHLVAAPPIQAATQGRYDSLDGYEWLLATAAHIDRHTKQILEVKADPRFPAK